MSIPNSGDVLFSCTPVLITMLQVNVPMEAYIGAMVVQW